MVQSFFLLGEKKDEKHGSVLHGFSPDILASIWGVDESLAKKVLEAQKGAGIIKVEKKLTLPEIARAHNAFFGEFSFNLVDTQPELLVPRGGCANFVNCKKMPTLEKFKIGLSAALVKLEKVRAREAPTCKFWSRSVLLGFSMCLFWSILVPSFRVSLSRVSSWRCIYLFNVPCFVSRFSFESLLFILRRRSLKCGAR